MHFQNPEYFGWALALPVFALLDAGWLIWQRHRARAFMESRFHAVGLPLGSFWGLGMRLALWFLGVLAVLTALARPQGAALDPNPVAPKAVTVYLVLDVSLSMQARDVAPDRLAAAKAELRDLIGRLSGQRIGLAVFAGEARVLCPATWDHEALLNALERVRAPMPVKPGSDPAAGLALALEKLAGDPGPGRAVVLVADGEESVAPDLAETARNAWKAGVQVFTLGVGTPAGAPIPVGNDLWGQVI